MKSQYLCRLSGSNGIIVRLACSLLVPGCVAFLLPVATFAGGVVTNCTEADLRAAMAGGGTVTFACDGAITLASTITNMADTRLDGSGHAVTITGPQAFYVTNSTLSIIGLTIANCCAARGAAIFNDGGAVNLCNVILQNNSVTPICAPSGPASMNGGAIYNQGGILNATNCTFTGNAVWTPYGAPGFPSGFAGGAVYNAGGQVNLQRSVFNGNAASAGDVNYGLPDPAFAAYGGAVYNGGNLVVDFCAFVGNRARGGHGGNAPINFYGASGGPGGAAYGGAIYNAGSITVSRSLFASNSVAGGGGGDGARGADGQIAGGNGGAGANGASAGGGALYGGGTVVNCTFAWNSASAGGGGYGGGGGTSYAAIGGAGGNGGNGGSAFGGAISGGNLLNCTIAFNFAQPGGGGLGGGGGYGPHSSGAPGTDGVSGSASGGASGCVLVNTLIAWKTPGGGDTFPDPKLGPLADNGGPTLTMALLPGSPAIDAEDTTLAPATDQRGFPRPAGSAADVGAYEFGSMLPVLSIARSGPSLFDILVKGNSNQWCRLLVSSNLSSWVPIATNQIGADGTVDFSFDGSAESSFYRVVMP